ncbi:transcriptional regulator, AraC family with amidase-like domain [Jatrophihabitans endophyticus]|uniref:Transcriptional regulator, AraC family with amidase-like domain n=1 Tax=Jatrophihabitans endophyticus TaxID=1206085 RepID=A0A1M5N3I4_9ACTN|nr:helix-turn-helix domain-containing protein [Jatrophihabitans endophyticus]SHG83729.1 transcriptional regulator, AraC family with amidase-like domain [Jatrophihabitans endophyticus]
MSVHRVVVLLLPPVVGFDATIPPQLFGAAVTDEGAPLYDVVTAGLTTDPVVTESGYAIVPSADAGALATADTVLVPGTRYHGPRYEGIVPAELAAALRLVRPGTRLVSICTGAFVLAAAGLLDGRPATTHWAYGDALRTLYPEVRLDADLLFVDDGDVLTSAGVAAGVDLCLHLIRRDHGTVVANRAARQCVVPPWRDGGQAQFIERPLPGPAQDSTAAARDWALGHLGEAIDVARLAAEARMSVRTFNRRFRAETGRPPGTWLAEQRLEHARRLLEGTDLAVDDVARRAGLGTGAALRLRMRDAVGLSPTAYRRRFRGTPTGDGSGQPRSSLPKVSQRDGAPVR